MADSNSKQQRLSQKLITLTAEELERARKLVVTSTTTKGSQKNPLTKKFIRNPRKSTTQQSPHRSKSRADQQHDPFEQVLGDKLAEICQRKERDKNNLTPSFVCEKSIVAGEYKKAHTSLHVAMNRTKSVPKKKNTKPTSKSLLGASGNLKKAKQAGNAKENTRAYHTHNSLNLYNLIRREVNQSPSTSLNATKIVDEEKARKVPKLISKKVENEKKLIVTANNSYIHNLNISPDAFSYCSKHKDPSKPSISNVDVSLNPKSTGKSTYAIELELSRRLESANSYEGYEKQIKILDAHKEALLNVITLDTCFGSVLERIKDVYDVFIEETVKKHDEELQCIKSEHDKSTKAKIMKLEKELQAKEETIKLQKQKIAELSKQANVKKVPKLDLSKVHKSPPLEEPNGEPEIASDLPSFNQKHIVTDVNIAPIKKLGIPRLNFEKLEKNKGYHDEFMAKESEFSPSWREKLAKEKRY